MSLTQLAVSKLITAGTRRQSGRALLGALAERLFNNSLPAVMVSAVRASPLKETAPVHAETTAPHLRQLTPPGLSPCCFPESGLYQHLSELFAHFSPLLHNGAKHPQILLRPDFWVARDDIQSFHQDTNRAGLVAPRRLSLCPPSCARNRFGSPGGRWHPLPTMAALCGQEALGHQ